MRWVRWRRYLVAAAVVGAAACHSTPASNGDAGVFTPPDFGDAGAGTNKEVGEDCSVGGPAACKSGLCFHYLPNAASGFVCSHKCEASSECPVSWGCLNVYPGSGNDYCVPPRNWVPQVAQGR